jgi:hypothetical protein
MRPGVARSTAGYRAPNAAIYRVGSSGLRSVDDAWIHHGPGHSCNASSYGKVLRSRIGNFVRTQAGSFTAELWDPTDNSLVGAPPTCFVPGVVSPMATFS